MTDLDRGQGRQTETTKHTMRVTDRKRERKNKIWKKKVLHNYVHNKSTFT